MSTRPRPLPRSGRRRSRSVRHGSHLSSAYGPRSSELVPSVVTVKLPIWLGSGLPAASLMPQALSRMTCPNRQQRGGTHRRRAAGRVVGHGRTDHGSRSLVDEEEAVGGDPDDGLGERHPRDRVAGHAGCMPGARSGRRRGHGRSRRRVWSAWVGSTGAWSRQRDRSPRGRSAAPTARRWSPLPGRSRSARVRRRRSSPRPRSRSTSPAVDTTGSAYRPARTPRRPR